MAKQLRVVLHSLPRNDVHFYDVAITQLVCGLTIDRLVDALLEGLPACFPSFSAKSDVIIIWGDLA